jgi:hypothetical protein
MFLRQRAAIAETMPPPSTTLVFRLLEFYLQLLGVLLVVFLESECILQVHLVDLVVFT